MIEGNQNARAPDRISRSVIGKITRAYARMFGSTGDPAPVLAVDATEEWLAANRLERMDATHELFDPIRRQFHLDRYRFASARVFGKEVLDCACGTGYGVRLLCHAGQAARVIGVDVEGRAIQYAWMTHNAGRTYFIAAPGDRLPLVDESVDVVTSFETIEHVPQDAALVGEFHRVLRPEGVLIISTPNQWPLADTPFHVREYDRDSFLNVLAPRFECVELYNQNSGSPTPLNHDQPRGIVPTKPENQELAECFIALCRRR